MSGQGRDHLVEALGTYHYPKGPLYVNRMVLKRLLFIYFSFIFISWRLITLQYCTCFCHILT